MNCAATEEVSLPHVKVENEEERDDGLVARHCIMDQQKHDADNVEGSCVAITIHESDCDRRVQQKHDAGNVEGSCVAITIHESDCDRRAACAEMRSTEVVSGPVRGAERQESQVDSCGMKTGARNITLGREERKAKRPTRFRQPKPDSLIFALRLSILASIAMVFALVIDWPDAIWLYITFVVVSWFTDLDVASVVYMILGRIIGTVLGCAVGLTFGFISLTIPSATGQRAFIGIVIVFFGFASPLAYMKHRHQLKTLGAYPWLLGFMTIAIVWLPFIPPADGTISDGSQPGWFPGTFRALNILIGCIIALVVHLTVFPRSTKEILRERVSKQIVLTGRAVEAVLLSARKTGLGNHESVPRLADIVAARVRRSGSTHEDEYDHVYEAYSLAVGHSQGLQKFFDLLDFDILKCCRPRATNKSQSFRVEAAMALERCSRIQSNVIMIDELIRTDIGSPLSFTSEQIDVLIKVGCLIESILQFESDDGTVSKRRSAEKLIELLQWVRKEKKTTYSTSTEAPNDQDNSEWMRVLANKLEPVQLASMCDDMSSYRSFLGFVEQLIARSLRLYYRWEPIASA